MLLVGNDLFLTKPKFSLSLDHMDVIANLYQPLLSKQALCLYYTLVARQLGLKYETHHMLCEKMQVRIEELEQARSELEQFLLVRTFELRQEKSNIYYYYVLPPKSYEQFLKHDLFARLLTSKVGLPYVQRQLEKLKESDDMEAFEEITSVMQYDFAEWSYEKEQQFSHTMEEAEPDTEYDPYHRYDFQAYCMASDPKCFLLPHKEIRMQDFSLINYYGQSNQIPHDAMVKLVVRNFNREQNCLNQDSFKQSIQHYVRKEGITETQPLAADRYALNAVQFVATLQANMKLAQSEIESFDRLVKDYQIKQEVFNVLLEYTWKKTENFNYKFMDKICASWSRSGVNTKEKALQVLEEAERPKEPVKQTRTRSPRIVEPVPVYRERTNESSDIDYERLQKLLDSL